jgi:acetyl-CoA acetyltransferase
MAFVKPSDRQQLLTRQVAVIGVGDTDYAEDYRRTRAGQPATDGYGYATLAFRRALADSGIAKSRIDGLVVGPSLAYERTAELLGLDVSYGHTADAGNAVVQAAFAIVTGMASTVAVVYGNDHLAAGVQYGGVHAMGGEKVLPYVYYAPWGLTAQGSFYAMTTRAYFEHSGLTSRELGEVAVAQRMHAQLNDNAVMRRPLTIDDYLASREIVSPLRLFDYTIINDGGVAMIITSAQDAARNHADRAVVVAGMAKADLNVDATSMRPRLTNFYRPAQTVVAENLFNMVGYGPEAIDAVQIYDSFSVHIPMVLAGMDYTTDADVGKLLASGALRPGGRLPVNTGGGHLSESYMQGWNHQVESVRQLRGEAGARQVPNASRIQYFSEAAGKLTTIIYEGPAA